MTSAVCVKLDLAESLIIFIDVFFSIHEQPLPHRDDPGRKGAGRAPPRGWRRRARQKEGLTEETQETEDDDEGLRLVNMACTVKAKKKKIKTKSNFVVFSISMYRPPGLQLRKSEQNGFHAYFLISQPNPMM